MLSRLIRFVCEVAAERLYYRHITRGTGEAEDLYLSRYMLLNGEQLKKRLQPHISVPLGNWDWRLYLHHFSRSDMDQELHNHPWKQALSFILTGGYSEERLLGDSMVWRKLIKPGTFNYITADTFHRVDLTDPENGAWTLFLVRAKAQSWGFWDRNTKKFTPWRQFVSGERPDNIVPFAPPVPWRGHSTPLP